MTVTEALHHVRSRIHPNCSESLLGPEEQALRVLSAEVNQLQDTVSALLYALADAKDVIKNLHGPNQWEIYDRCSPEMKRLNKAMSVVFPA